MFVSLRRKQAMLAVAGFVAIQSLCAAHADTGNTGVALGAHAGTPGYGLELDVGNDLLAARVGYSFLNYSRSISDTDVRYDGKLKINNASVLLDWYVMKGGFHLSAGATNGGVKVDAKGTPTGGTYELNGTTYTAAQVGSLNGRIKLGNSFAPYVGLGWGNPVDKAGHLSFLVDVGAIYGGTPSVTLNVVCGTASPEGTPLCTRLKQDAQAEKADLQDNVSIVKWYPVINLGLAYRF